MRKVFLAFFLLPVLFYSGTSYAGTPDKTHKKSQEMNTPESPSPAEISKQKDRAKNIEKKKVELESTQWQVSLVSKDPKSKPESDTFVFQNSQFKSENQAKRGFNPTNYTVTIPEGDDASAVFETMQSGKEGHVFVKGHWTKEVMDGQILEQSEDGKSNREFYFTNAKMTKIAPEEAKADAAAPAADESSNSAGQALVSKESSRDSSTDKSLATTKKKRS